MNAIPATNGPGAFDFLIGRWNVSNRRLTSRLTGSTEWEEFPATAICHGPLLGGGANLDELTFSTKGAIGLTLRVLDPTSQDWSLYWVSDTDGALAPPMRGRFGDDGRGEFHGDDTHEGVPIRCRFIWSGITADSAHWEQAFSADDGTSWETNWTMEYARTARS
jgi:hypothetical protein